MSVLATHPIAASAAAVAMAWTVSGSIRAIASLAIDRHWSHALYALALGGVADAFLDPQFLCAAALGAAAAIGIAALATRLGLSSVGASAVALAVYWAAVTANELTSRTALRDVMTDRLALTTLHVAIVAVAGLGFVISLLATRRRDPSNMTRATLPLALTVLLALTARGSAVTLATPDPAAVNVVLITVDTLRADHIGAYGYARDTSPRLDGLAEEGVLYERSISQAPNTHPSMASMLTSEYPSKLGGKALKYIHYSLPTLAEVLQNAGYDTAAIVSNVWLKDQMGFDEGFGVFDQTSAMSEFYAEQDRIRWKNASHVSDAALDWLSDAPEKPFFLWLHYLDPHHPYDPPAPYDTKFQDSPHEHDAFLAELREMPTREQTRALVKMGNGEEPVTDPEFQAIVDQYDGEIAYNDMQIGRVLDELDRLGLADSTMVVVTSDHGEEFRDHAGWGHSHSLHRELLHVPLIIRYPAAAEASRGVRVHQRVRTLDIAPTIVNAAGQTQPAAMRGRDLRQLSDSDRVAISMLTRKHWTSIEEDRWKLVTRPGGSQNEQDEAAPVELYDLQADPYEHRNVATDNDAAIAQLAATLHRLVGTDTASETISETARQLDPATRKQLEALGYID